MKQFTIYQINGKKENARNFMFTGLEMLEHLGIKKQLSLDLYDKVYDGWIDDEANLDEIFAKFQGKKPEGYKGRSISVSDIIRIEAKYFFCDDYDWVDITEELPKPKLEKGEKYECIEDYVMDDGSIAYKKGKVYEMVSGFNLKDEQGNEHHGMGDERDFYFFFKKVEA